MRTTIESARRQLDEQIEKGSELDSQLDACANRDEFLGVSGKFHNWDNYNRTLLENLFRGPIVREYEWRLPFAIVGVPDLAADVRDRKNDLQSAVRHLASIVERLPLWTDKDASSASHGGNVLESKQAGDQVFIVHGRDEASKHEVARFLERLDIMPLILNEQPNQGRTLVEKLEHYASVVGFVVVILSPDDIGSLANEPELLAARARQNVIFEMGYFIGVLNRSRVCAVLAGDLERPSDIDGVAYLSLRGNWKVELANELRAAGFPVDKNRI